VSADRFVILGTPIVIEFLPPVLGKPQIVQVTGDGPRPVLQQRVEPFAPSGTELSKFEGHYRSDELEVTYSISARGPSLLLQVPGQADAVLQPIFSDAFAGGAISVVEVFARHTWNHHRIHRKRIWGSGTWFQSFKPVRSAARSCGN